ncbi:5-methylcytosine restriction system specificity protein McrC [Paranoxybacillus vitaminiphilus]|uniref:5-methylcytosine restriction system specificity protein McrC n=1 Tax=Paranoxybacillus vitaminiphilus TaxID=581036 RepID=UPI000DBA45C0
MRTIETIIDVKYKNPIHGIDVNVSQADIYQMLSYSLAYCKNIILVYPMFRINNGYMNPLGKYEVETEKWDN